MDYKQIEQLLERYWQCETSLEEEQQLRTFFSESNVPAYLLRYKELFVYQQIQQEITLSEDFDKRVLAEVEAPVVEVKYLSLITHFMPLLKAVAVVAVVLSLGGVMQHSFFSEVKEIAAADTIGQQIVAPSVALSGEAAALLEQQVLDSLHRAEQVEIKK